MSLGNSATGWGERYRTKRTRCRSLQRLRLDAENTASSLSCEGERHPEERTFDRESLVAMAVIAVSVELLEPYPVAAQATLS